MKFCLRLDLRPRKHLVHENLLSGTFLLLTHNKFAYPQIILSRHVLASNGCLFKAFRFDLKQSIYILMFKYRNLVFDE